jgi:hypothetical protein
VWQIYSNLVQFPLIVWYHCCPANEGFMARN